MPKSEKNSKPEILRSGSYWKDFHAARAARATRLAPPNWNASFSHPLSDADKITTIVPGRSQPLVRIANAPAPRRPKSTGADTTRSKPVYTPNRGTNSILACRERDDEKLLAALASSRARTPAAVPRAGLSEDDAAAIQKLVHARANAFAAMARKGRLGEPAATFTAMTDDEVKAWLKTPLGKERLEAAMAAGRAATEKLRAGPSI
ncbi:hypothetical protein B0H11DRAFT_2235339 [Mycena galericulata]|nr:hypothetical protein B0H11DRAFT_2235339 [Mycena galericulata]